MSGRLFIRLLDGQAVGHAIHPDNLREIGIDPEAPDAELAAQGFAPYEFSPAPAVTALDDERYDEPVLQASGIWTRPRSAVPKPTEERASIIASAQAHAEDTLAGLLATATARKDDSPEWATYFEVLSGFQIADPFGVKWPWPPSNIDTIKVHSA